MPRQLPPPSAPVPRISGDLPAVLMVGPSERSAGGMSSVALQLIDVARQLNPPADVRLVGTVAASSDPRVILFLRAIWQVFRSDYDVLHIHLASRGSTVRKATLAAIAGARRKPYVIHLHGGGYADFYQQLPRPFRSLIGTFFQKAAHVIVLSPEWREFVRFELTKPDAPISVVHNGVAQIPPVEAATILAPSVLFLGRITRDKGVDVLLQCLPRLLTDFRLNDWSFVFAGPAPEADILADLRRFCREYPDRVVYRGPVGVEERDALLRRAGLLVLPSRVEALPLVLLEAMSAGVACVSTRVGAVPSLFVDKEEILTVPVDCCDELSASLIRLMTDHRYRAEIAANGNLKWKSSFTINRMANEIFEIWRSCGTLQFSP